MTLRVNHTMRPNKQLFTKLPNLYHPSARIDALKPFDRYLIAFTPKDLALAPYKTAPFDVNVDEFDDVVICCVCYCVCLCITLIY